MGEDQRYKFICFVKIQMSYLGIEEVLGYVNEARTNPKKFAEYVQEDIDSFIDDRHMPLVPGCLYSVNESRQTWVDCKNFLLNQPKLPPYELSEALNLTTKDHATDMVQNNVDGHTGSDGSSLTDRLERRCGEITSGAWAENIGSDFDVEGRKHALKTVLGLIIDDGVMSRGHRKNIFSKDYRFIGIHSKLKGDKIKTVMNFTSDDLPLLNSVYKHDGQDQTKKNPSKKKKTIQPHQKARQIKGIGGFKPQHHTNHQESQNFGWGNSPFHQGGFSSHQGGFQMPNNYKGFSNGKEGKYVVSCSTSSSTQTVNGKTVTKVIEKIKYSDGTTEQNENIITN